MRSALLAVLVLLTLPAAAAAAPELHAHRGGAISFGMPDSYEDTMPAFERRVQQTPDAWLEMDALVSADGVPYVLHDSTLDRTTDCTGVVGERTSLEIDACRVDVLGVGSESSATLVPAPAGGPVVRIPRLDDVLAFAKRTGARVNLEIKRIPGDPGYVPGDTAFATRITEVVKAAGLDPAKLIIQSFDPSNLETARSVLPGVTLSYLTLAGDAAAVELCASRGYAFLSPGGVPSAATIAQARSLGVKVVPFTLNTESAVKAAAAVGVDAIITDDVPLARRALGLETTGAPSPSPSPSPGGSGPTPPPSSAPAPQTSPAPVAAPRRGRATLGVPSRRRRATLRLGGSPSAWPARRAPARRCGSPPGASWWRAALSACPATAAAARASPSPRRGAGSSAGHGA